MKEVLPICLSIGMTKNEFMDSTPVEIEPYIEAYKIKETNLDTNMWTMGIYVFNAVSVAVNSALNGKKYKGEYLEKPLHQFSEKKTEVLSEDKIKKERKAFLQSLQIMQTNFELNHKDS